MQGFRHMIIEKKISFLSLVATLLCFQQSSGANIAEQHELLLKQVQSEHPTAIATQEDPKIITFNYENEDLTDIINTLAQLKKINVIFPAKEADKIKTKVTIALEHKLSLEEAWNLTATLIDIAGYSLIKEGDWFEIVKISKDIAREPLPLYIAVPPEKLPDTDARIRYIYYLSNLKIATNAMTDTKNELRVILEKLLPEIKDSKNVYLDSRTNSIIISEKAASIKSVMNIIEYLDKIELTEKMEIIPLRNLSAKNVADLFTKMQEPADKNRYRLDTKTEPTYIPQNIRIMPYERGNALIVLGKRQDIDRVREFTYKYLDVPLESGKSILHIYKLQYLDAKPFAAVLDSIINKKAAGSTGQAAGATKPTEGVERYFDEVIITHDTPMQGEQPSTGEKTKGLGEYWGGNKLIIACRNEDWERIRKLIEDLDVPQPQVILEVLVAELTISQIRQIATQLRNPACILPNHVNAQSAQVTGIISTNPNGNTPTLAPDLLQLTPGVSPAASQVLLTPSATPTGSTTAGSTVISYSDKNGSTWGLTEILDFIDATNIITNPHIVAKNNVETHVNITTARFLPDQPVNIGAGSTQIKQKWINAPLDLYVTPRISSANTVNLSLKIDIIRYATTAATNDPSLQTRTTRTVTTNANVFSGDILSLGGLSRLDTSNNYTQVPILGDIPILGYFFKNRSKTNTTTHVTVFICPTIIQPRLRDGISNYTTDYVNISKSYAAQGLLFDSLQDPVTRWFFRDQEENPIGDIDEFLAQDRLLAKQQYAPNVQVNDTIIVKQGSVAQEVIKEQAILMHDKTDKSEGISDKALIKAQQTELQEITKSPISKALSTKNDMPQPNKTDQPSQH